MIHTHTFSPSTSLLCSLSLCAVPFVVMSMNAPTFSEGTALLSKTVCVCVYVCVCMPICVFLWCYHTHAVPLATVYVLPLYWFNPQTQERLQSVFTSIVIWPGVRGLTSSRFHPVGPFISGPKLIHQWLKARQEKPSEERGWIFLFDVWNVLGRARER